MIRYFGVLLMLALSGCTSYPVIKQNILNDPIQVSVQRTQKPAPQKDAVVSQIIKKLKSDQMLSDQYAVNYVEKQLASAFDAEIKETPPSNENTEELIRNFLTESLANESGNYRDLFKLNSSVAFPRDLNFSPLQGRLTINPEQSFNYQGTYSSGKFATPDKDGPRFYKINANFSLSGKINSDDKLASLTVSNAGYDIDCLSIIDDYVQHTSVNLAQINEQVLISKLQQMPSFAQARAANIANAKWGGIDALYNDMKRTLEYRYTKTNAAPITKTERKYPIDFVTAKARLQRALGEFKYDEGKSAFTFSKTYTINDLGYIRRTDVNIFRGDANLDHKYQISLFPDKNETVVEFSGDYSSATDALGGPDLHGATEFNEKMNGYIQSISKLLN